MIPLFWLVFDATDSHAVKHIFYGHLNKLFLYIIQR